MDSVVVLSTVDTLPLRDRLERIAASTHSKLTVYPSVDDLLEGGRRLHMGLAVLEVGTLATAKLLQCIADLSLHRRVVLIGESFALPLAVAALHHGCADVLEVDDQLDESLLEHLKAEAAYLARIAPLRERLALLSNRESEVISLMVEGISTKEVAVRLQISPKTASEHVANVLAKLRVENTAQLLRMICANVSTRVDPRLRGWLSTHFSREHL